MIEINIETNPKDIVDYLYSYGDLNLDRVRECLWDIFDSAILTKKFLPIILEHCSENLDFIIHTLAGMPKPSVATEILALNIWDPQLIIKYVFDGIGFATNWNERHEPIESYIKFIEDNGIEYQYLLDIYASAYFGEFGNTTRLTKIKAAYLREICKHDVILDVQSFMNVIDLDNILFTSDVEVAKLMLSKVDGEIPDELIMKNFIELCKLYNTENHKESLPDVLNYPLINYLELFGERLMSDKYYLVLFRLINRDNCKMTKKIFATYVNQFEKYDIIIESDTMVQEFEYDGKIDIDELMNIGTNMRPSLYTKHYITHFTNAKVEVQIQIFWLTGNVSMLSSGLFDLGVLDWTCLQLGGMIEKVLRFIGIYLEFLLQSEHKGELANFMDLLHSMGCINEALKQIWSKSNSAYEASVKIIVDLLLDHGADIDCLIGVKQHAHNNNLRDYLVSKSLNLDA
jgi:hypothetical protein